MIATKAVVCIYRCQSGIYHFFDSFGKWYGKKKVVMVKLFDCLIVWARLFDCYSFDPASREPQKLRELIGGEPQCGLRE